MKNKLKSVKRGSKSAATSQANTNPNRAYIEMARVAARLNVLTGKPYRTALSRIGKLLSDEIEENSARRLAAGTVTCVWIGPDGREFARVDFEPELFALVKRAASDLGITVHHFFDNAIHHKIDSLHSRRAA